MTTACDQAGCDHGGEHGLISFDIDLGREENRRRARVLAALGPDWDPAAVLRDEDAAHALLYSGLNAEQLRIHDELVAAGVLPAPEQRRAAD